MTTFWQLTKPWSWRWWMPAPERSKSRTTTIRRRCRCWGSTFAAARHLISVKHYWPKWRKSLPCPPWAIIRLVRSQRHRGGRKAQLSLPPLFHLPAQMLVTKVLSVGSTKWQLPVQMLVTKVLPVGSTKWQLPAQMLVTKVLQAGSTKWQLPAQMLVTKVLQAGSTK